MVRDQHREAGAQAGHRDDAQRGQSRYQAPAPEAARGAPRAGLVVPSTTAPGLVGQPERDVLDGYPARRLGSKAVQQIRQLPFLGVHDVTPPIMSSARPGASLSRDRALAACAFTVPTEQPMASAVCDSLWSAK